MNIEQPSKHLISALFNDYHKAENAVQEAIKLGYREKEINVLMSEETKKKYILHDDKIQEEPSDVAVKGAGVGGSLGVTTGALIGALIAMGSIFAIPASVGLLISGPIAIALAGAGAGGIAGGLVGALIMTGISEASAKEWATEITKGGILISMKLHTNADYEILKSKWMEHQGVILAS